MNTTKKIFVLILLLVLLATVIMGLVWHSQHFVMVDFKFYPRNEAVLDLRGEELSTDAFDKIQDKLPGTKIIWMVPFQNAVYPQDTQELTIEVLRVGELPAFQYFTSLETVHAENCTDYENLRLLQERYPQVDVRYLVQVDGTGYSPAATELHVESITDEELGNLEYLPQLQKVLVTGCGDAAQLEKLHGICQKRNIAFELTLGGKTWPATTRELTASDVREEELELLRFLPELSKVHLINPTASAEALKALQANYPNAEISWEISIGGKTFPWDVEEVDLKDVKITDLNQLEALMECLPKLKKLSLGRFSTPKEGRGDYEMWESPITNQDVADYRERVRDRYKVAWEVQVGRLLTARTDDTTFRPDSHGVGRLFDDEVYNLRYCEDMVCIDVGHMSFSDCSWVAYMPHLKYLILAWTGVYDLTPLNGLKELIYLEVDWSPIKDYSPLIGCTALEDLNIGSTYADITPLCEMTWLKNLWMIFCGGGKAYKASQALPDTRVVASGTATVAGGWRRLPNYYAQRDALNMYYMN